MGEQNIYKIGTIILACLLFLLNSQYMKEKRENKNLSSLVDEYSYALEEANENIDDANSMIEDAQSNAWSDYESMGYSLENLSTVDTVSEP